MTISKTEHKLRMGCLPPHEGKDHTINQCHKLVDHDQITHHETVKWDCCDPREDGNLCNDRLNITGAVGNNFMTKFDFLRWPKTIKNDD